MIILECRLFLFSSFNDVSDIIDWISDLFCTLLLTIIYNRLNSTILHNNIPYQMHIDCHMRQCASYRIS